MKSPDFWSRPAGVLSALLSPLGFLYGAATLWRMGWSGVCVDVPVICVGNLTLGGAGKTPVALALAHMLIEAGERPVFLSRGYGGRLKGPVLVETSHSFQDVGDEPLLLRRVAPVVVAKDRVKGAKFARAQGASILIMDDGLQNPSLAKTLSLIVVDAASGVGNGCVFPAGPLRAPIERQLTFAQGVVRIGTGDFSLQTSLPLFAARLICVDDLKGQRIIAFAGIGRPEKFFTTVRELGADIVDTHEFGDHHPYSLADEQMLLARAEALGAALVTTEKDGVRLSAGFLSQVRLVAVKVDFEDMAGFQDFVLSGCRRFRAQCDLIASDRAL